MARALIFTFVILLSAIAQAGFININGVPRVDVQVLEDGKIKIQVNHSLMNSGNDRAEEVYSKITIGQVVFEGEKKSLLPRRSASWRFEETVPLNELRCERSDSCLADSFPVAGRFPVLVTIYYRDVNGYPFSKTFFDFIEVGSHIGAGGREMRNPRLEYTFSLEKDKDDDEGEIHIKLKNQESEEREYVLFVSTSEELEVDRNPIKFSLGRNEEKTLSYEIENDKGLAGSGYSVNGILIIGSDEVRTVVNQGRVFFIPHSKPMQVWWVLFGLSILLGPVFLFYLKGKKA